MAIEKLESANSKPLIKYQYPLFQANNTVVAGTMEVKHPLIKGAVLLIGFLVEDNNMNQENFIINGKKIEYKQRGNDSYFINSAIIYQKVIFDNKKTPWIAFAQDERIRVNSYYIKYETASQNRYEYYLFDKINAEYAECAADEIYALCKFRENGEFKHAIFNINEITPVVE